MCTDKTQTYDISCNLPTPHSDLFERLIPQGRRRVADCDELIPRFDCGLHNLITNAQQRVSLKQSIVTLAFILAVLGGTPVCGIIGSL